MFQKHKKPGLFLPANSSYLNLTREVLRLEQLIAEYKETLKFVRNLHRIANEKDKKVISGMISDF
jgi:hypothetical protein